MCFELSSRLGTLLLFRLRTLRVLIFVSLPGRVFYLFPPPKLPFPFPAFSLAGSFSQTGRSAGPHFSGDSVVIFLILCYCRPFSWFPMGFISESFLASLRRCLSFWHLCLYEPPPHRRLTFVSTDVLGPLG